MPTQPTRFKKGLNGTQLKLFACFSMLVDHTAAALLLYCAPRSLYFGMRLFGRLAFPIYLFLLVEGFCHTHSVKRYALRLLLLAVISELPFDLAFYGAPYWGYQNVYFTLLLALLALICCQYGEVGPLSRRMVGYGGALLLAALAWLLHTDYDALGVAIAVLLYCWRRQRSAQCWAGATAFVASSLVADFEFIAAFSFVPLFFYNGERGSTSRCAQWLFYLFYPLHLVVLTALRTALL